MTVKTSMCFKVALILLLIIFGLHLKAVPGQAEEEFTIVTTFTILEDFTRAVTGERGDLRVICPAGAEVHEWELLPGNFIDLEEADIVFYNGLNVEQWMQQVRAVVGSEVPVIAVGEESDFPLLPITTGDYAGDPDPHIWMDVRGAISYVEVIREALIAHNPEHEASYREHAREYISELRDLHRRLKKKLAVIPERDRVLITTEAAFIYFAESYGFVHDGVWGTNTEEEGTPRQLQRILQVIEDREPAGIFWESTVSDRYMLSMGEDTGVPVYGPLYVDSLAASGTGLEGYVDMMEHNARLLVRVLGP